MAQSITAFVEKWVRSEASERIAGIRDLVQSTDAAWTTETVARSFKNAQVESVEPVLESLAAVGVLVAFEGPEGRRWKRVGKG